MNDHDSFVPTSRKTESASLELARSHLDSGEEEKARELAMRACSKRPGDPENLCGWAGIFEELGMAARALEWYKAAVRSVPEDCGAMLKLAVLLGETGHDEESIHYLKKILGKSPDHVEARRLLGEHYRSLGFAGQAEATGPASIAAAPHGPGEREIAARRFPVAVSSRDTETFLRLFSGKELGYAVQRAQVPDGSIIFDFHGESLSSDLVLSHLRGDITLAAYPLRTDNTARYGAVSIRARGSVARANRKNPSVAALLAERARAHLLLMVNYAARAGIPAYPEDCGGVCLRLWFFFDGFYHFLKIRKFVMELLEHGPVPDGRLAVEPVLATKPTGLGWEENAVLLPLGIHRATLRRCFFLDPEGGHEAEQIKYLRRIRALGPPENPGGARGPGTACRRLSGEKERMAEEAGFGHGDRVWAKSRCEPTIGSPQAMKIFKGCGVIAELVERALRGRNLRHEEKLALFHSLGMVEDGPGVIHDTLANCPDYDCEKVARQTARLRPNPISCLKLRKLLPEIASSVECGCVFDMRGGKYPSPVMHVSPHLVPTSLEMTFSSVLPLKRVAERYLSLKRHQEETATALARLEGLLERGFRVKGLASLKVGRVRLARVEAGEKSSWEVSPS
ncbi:MAG: CRISPR-associated primase-polymerase type A1 [Syntrophobacteraceae bacterium]|nr:CRISPR-associated primase-polymerase type A1 [Syntrophobacteraceae bacterium]